MPALNEERRYVGLRPRPGAVSGVKISSIEGDVSRSGLEREVLVADVGAEDRPPGRPRDDVAAHPSLLEAVVGAVFGRRVDPDAVVGDLRRITPSEVRAHVDLAAGEAERGGGRLDVLVVRERVQALDVEEGVVAGELPVAGAEREAAAAPHAAEERIEAARRFSSRISSTLHTRASALFGVGGASFFALAASCWAITSARDDWPDAGAASAASRHASSARASARSGREPSTSRGHRAQGRHAGKEHASPSARTVPPRNGTVGRGTRGFFTGMSREGAPRAARRLRYAGGHSEIPDGRGSLEDRPGVMGASSVPGPLGRAVGGARGLAPERRVQPCIFGPFVHRDDVGVTRPERRHGHSAKGQWRPLRPGGYDGRALTDMADDVFGQRQAGSVTPVTPGLAQEPLQDRGLVVATFADTTLPTSHGTRARRAERLRAGGRGHRGALRRRRHRRPRRPHRREPAAAVRAAGGRSQLALGAARRSLHLHAPVVPRRHPGAGAPAGRARGPRAPAVAAVAGRGRPHRRRQPDRRRAVRARSGEPAADRHAVDHHGAAGRRVEAHRHPQLRDAPVPSARGPATRSRGSG